MFNESSLNSIQAGAGMNLGGVFTVEGMSNAVIPIVFGAAGILLLLNIVTAGLKLMTSQGDPKAVGGAQAKLTTSAIGILIMFIAYWAVKLIMQFFGINVIIFG